MKYKKILLKLSGESLMGSQNSGIDPQMLEYFASEIAGIVQEKVKVAVVIGGGNIFRGMQGAKKGFDRVQGLHGNDGHYYQQYGFTNIA